MLQFVSLGSGSSGNSALVFTESTRLLIDAGLSSRQLRHRLQKVGVRPDALDGILITHEHRDHTRGMEVLCRGIRAPVYCNAITGESLSDTIKSPPARRIMKESEPFTVGDISVCGFAVMHDAVDPMGFVFEHQGARLGFVSDTGHVTEAMRSALLGVSFLFVESNHDELRLQNHDRRPWYLKQRIASRHGHLSNAQAAQLVAHVAASGPLERVILGHLSRECNTPDLAEATVRDALTGEGAEKIRVTCAKSDQPIGPFPVKGSNNGGCGKVNRRTKRLPGMITNEISEGFALPDAPEEDQFAMLKSKILKVLDTLTDKERKVLESRFGLSGGCCRTLEEVGREFDLPREKIRMIEAKAMRKMRHPSRIRRLEEFVAGDGSPVRSRQSGKGSPVDDEVQSLAELIEQS